MFFSKCKISGKCKSLYFQGRAPYCFIYVSKWINKRLNRKVSKIARYFENLEIFVFTHSRKCPFIYMYIYIYIYNIYIYIYILNSV